MGVKIEMEKGNNLLPNKVKEMHSLMEKYYDNLPLAKFTFDILEKDEVILLTLNNQIYGFTTIELKEMNIDGRDILGIFSGNTIVHPDYAFKSELQQGFSRYASELMDKEPNKEIYWFLICKGYKTYRYLSIYFNDYYPNKDKVTPIFEQKIIDRYASEKYKDAYDREKGIIKNIGENDFLKEGVAPITSRVKKNKMNSFFEDKNPYHGKGDELVCLAKFSDDNLKKAFYRVSKRSQNESI